MPQTEPMTPEELIGKLGELVGLHNDLNGAVELISQRNRDILTKAAERARLEMVDAEETGSENDEAYNRGVEDAIKAIIAPINEKKKKEK